MQLSVAVVHSSKGQDLWCFVAVLDFIQQAGGCGAQQLSVAAVSTYKLTTGRGQGAFERNGFRFLESLGGRGQKPRKINQRIFSNY